MDDFSDDGFDELNVALLQELENNALESLQSQRPRQPNAGPGGLFRSQRLPGGAEVIEIDDDVDQADAEMLRELAHVAHVPAQHSRSSRLAVAAAPPPLPLPAYSQHSIANMPLPAASRQPPLQPQMQTQARTRPVHPVVPAGGRGPGRTITVARRPSVAAGLMAPADCATISDLQTRVRLLETDLYTANGKASVIQTLYNKAQAEHEAEIARIRKQKDDELAEQRQRAEVAVAAHRTAATELEFARQDLKEEVEKSRKGRRSERVGDGAPTTPRKDRSARSNWDVADGFDDVELLPSPSKGAGRRLKDVSGGATIPALERTPTKGKRRRPVADSPTGKPLELVAVATDDAAGTTRDPPLPAQPVVPPEKPPLLFLQEVLGHQSHPDEPSTIELFAQYSFPSNRSQSLAFLMLQRIPKLEGTQGTTRLMLDFCQLVLGIWSQCLREEYYSPVRALVSLLTYILTENPTDLASHILHSLLPLAQETSYLVAGPAFNCPGGSLADHPDYAVRQLAAEIDTGAIMSLLRLAALGCLTPSTADEPAQRPSQPATQYAYPDLAASAQTLFWSLISFEFVLLMLSSKQPPDAFLGMLSLLRTSALPDSIGPITNDPSRDAGVVASMVIDRITHHIDDPPRWATPCKYTEWDVRLSALGVLDCFAQSSFGRLSLAASNCAFPRLVAVFFSAYGELRDRDLLREPLHLAADDLSLPDDRLRAYGIGGFDLAQTLGRPISDTTDSSVEQPGSSCDVDRNFVPLVLAYVSAVVDLLHSIVTDPYTAAVANIPTKLAETRGGAQSMYLLIMARMGFRIDPVFSVGLRDETRQLALELFNLAATPEEQKDYYEWAEQSCNFWHDGTADPFSEAADADCMVP
ncbi:DNA repair protein [Grosmannia clavigera kw1407]|uniref:DNA repair protein n=1 Tax=Grosmannia clavigera (strain kw1407 / UAMH 11150) TaxID=655863 RepID=F0XIT3_GROCL|nr:DNA repair protein [Grosmannia clavigera kw1407]EFX02143.1 DNA repair protein [Grosmannia clavigera kw1407]